MKNSITTSILLLLLLSQEIFAQSVIPTPADVVSISTNIPDAYESWARPAYVVIRRSGGVKALTVPLVISGTAIVGTDYISSVGQNVTIPMGARELVIQLTPIKDVVAESQESITIQLGTSPDYTIEGGSSASVTIYDNSTTMSDEEATRFLIQAGFGADPDELSDVKTLGFDAWINAQVSRPKGYHQPVIQARAAAGKPIYHTATKIALWTQVMRRRYPASGIVQTDILRQRIAYSLLQIFVISQNVDALSLTSEGVANYYDRLLDGALGNFRNILFDISMHPCMGVYLSHLGNKKPNPSNNIYPDENFAREIMQLFSIGLWKLNQDGTRVLVGGQPVPSYSNQDITQFARVFTGLKFGGPDNQNGDYDNNFEDFKHPMQAFEVQHDTDPKTLLNSVTIPGGQTALQDINAAIDNLFNHQNTAPFISRLLIQRLVTSNPSPAYIGRVAAVFANNGLNVRGDMAAVVKAILLDADARSYSKTQESDWGKLREPYLTLMNIGKTFNAQPSNGDYESATYMYDFYLQEPFQSPSVFNFYLPSYRPPGELSKMGMFGPEFQIVTAVTAVESQNNLLNSVENQIARWGSEPGGEMILDFSQEIPLAGNPDEMIRKLSVRMVGGLLSPKSFQNIREAILKIEENGTTWQSDRVKMAAYLIGASAEYNVQK